MPSVPIPINSGVYKNVDGIELKDEQSELVDAYLGDLNQTVKRPGLETLTVLTGSNKVDGAYWWHNKGYLIAVSAGRVYKITKAGSTYTTTDLTGVTLSINSPVSFTTDGTYVFMANGGRIAYTDGTAATAYIADADAPTSVTHVAWLDGYLLCNEAATNRFRWSDVNNSLSWSAVSFASAAGDADVITALFVRNREIYLMGPKSLEIWENDGANPFSRISGGFDQTGCIAPYSISLSRESSYWLDQDRRIVSFDGRAAKRIATQYDKEIQKLGTPSDCVSTVFTIDGTSFVLFNFPTDNKCFVLNENNSTWSEWGSFQSSTGLYNRFRCQCMAFCPDWGYTVVGDNSTPTLNKLQSTVYSDNGDPVRAKRVTGYIDYGTASRKRSNKIRLRIKRGIGMSSQTPVMMLRWQDDNKQWSNQVLVSLGDIGDTEIPTQINCTGMFHARRYEWACADAVPFIFTLAEEDIDVLR